MEPKNNKGLIAFAVSASLSILFCLSFVLLEKHNYNTLVISNQEIEANHLSFKCVEKPINPEKIPKLFYDVQTKIFKTTPQTKTIRKFFKMKLKPSLDVQSKLVAIVDTIEDIVKDIAVDGFWQRANVTIVYGQETRNISFTKCLESSSIVAQMIQMDIMPLLNGVYATIIFLFL